MSSYKLQAASYKQSASGLKLEADNLQLPLTQALPSADCA
ncbi:Unknown protein sequence [Pseudomonas syringae pv. aceris]|nr:Unknown protein sequence [Pseudomonas syringae pv. aceris]